MINYSYKKEGDNSTAKIMYTCVLFTQDLNILLLHHWILAYYSQDFTKIVQVQNYSKQYIKHTIYTKYNNIYCTINGTNVLGRRHDNNHLYTNTAVETGPS